MRIRMNHDVVDSPDEGVNRYGYEAGQVYTTSDPLDYATRPLPISEALARHCVEQGWAEDADAVVPSGEASAPETPAAAPVESAEASSPPAQEAEPAPAPESEDHRV